MQSSEYVGSKNDDSPPGFARHQQGCPAVAPRQAAPYPPQPTQVNAALACCCWTLCSFSQLGMRLTLHAEEVGKLCHQELQDASWL